MLFAYSEEEAQRIPFQMRELSQEPGWGPTLYFGVVPFEELPTDPQAPEHESIGFVDLFQYDKDFKPPEGRYSWWNRSERESYFANTLMPRLLLRLHTALAGHTAMMAGVLVSGWRHEEFTGPLNLPEEEFTLALLGPEKRPMLVGFRKLLGVSLYFPVDTPPRYRYRLLGKFTNFAEALKKTIEENPNYVAAAPPGAGYSVDYLNRLFGHIQQNVPDAAIVGEFQLGDDVAPFPTGLAYDPATHEDAQLLPLLVYHSPNPTTPDSEESAGDKGYYTEPFVGNLHRAIIVDRGDHFTYLSRGEVATMEPERLESKRAVALDNLRAMLTEARGEGISVIHDPKKEMYRVTGLGRNQESALLLLPEFWEHLEPIVGGDMVAAVPSPGHLLVTKLTSATGREAVENACADIREDIGDSRHFSDELYYWQGATEGWRAMNGRNR